MRPLSFRAFIAAAIICTQIALTAPSAPAATLLFSDKFTGSSGALSSARWKTWWGTVRLHNNVASLVSPTPTSAGRTYSALATSRKAWTNYTFTYVQRNVGQLRKGSRPNTWECAWSMFRYRDLENYYYFILKPNGWELGKKHGSDDQIFLTTGSSPVARVGYADTVKITVVKATITIWVNGRQIARYTDRRPIGSGAIGIYEEDAHVHFDNTYVYSA